MANPSWPGLYQDLQRPTEMDGRSCVALGVRQTMWVTFPVLDSLKQETMSKQKPHKLAGWMRAGLRGTTTP